MSTKLKDLEKRLRDEPDNLGLRVMLAGALREADRQSDAVELYLSVAIAYREQGRSQQAIAVCRSILDIAPDDPRCHSLLSTLIASHKAREASASSSGVFGDEVLEVKTPPPPRDPPPTPPPMPRDKPPSIPPLVSDGRPAMISEAAPRSPGRTAPPPPPPRRAPTMPPLRAQPAPLETRSSSRLDETPLPIPIPYHEADPTTRSLKKMSEIDVLVPTPDPDDGLPVIEDAKTRPGADDSQRLRRAEGSGLSKAARRISEALIQADDLSAELDTRQRPRIASDELEKITQPPPTAQFEQLLALDDDDDDVTGSPADTRNMRRAKDEDTEESDDADSGGIPTLTDEDADEPTRPRETMLDLLIRTENEGPFGTAFFQPLPAEHRKGVLARFHEKAVKKGTTVIRQGEVGHSLVVVLKGQLLARVDRKGGTVELGAVGTGEFVGEGSLLARGPSQVHISALTDAELLMLAPRDFYEIAGAFPALWAELKDVAERRKRDLEMSLRRG